MDLRHLDRSLAYLRSLGGQLPTVELGIASAPLLSQSHLVFDALVANEATSAVEAARRLAGLGPGLTPAGDDILVGAIYALRATRRADSDLPQRLADVAAPRTTRRSGEWLRAAAAGQPLGVWNDLLRGLAAFDRPKIRSAHTRLRSQGHTSGPCAAWAFVEASARLGLGAS